MSILLMGHAHRKLSVLSPSPGFILSFTFTMERLPGIRELFPGKSTIETISAFYMFTDGYRAFPYQRNNRSEHY